MLGVTLGYSQELHTLTYAPAAMLEGEKSGEPVKSLSVIVLGTMCRPNPCQESQPLTREAAGRPQDCDCLSSSVRWAQRTKPTLGVNIGL